MYYTRKLNGESNGLFNLSLSSFLSILNTIQSRRWDSNPQSTDYKSVAIPISPLRHIFRTDFPVVTYGYEVVDNQISLIGAFIIFGLAAAMVTAHVEPHRQASF